MEINSVNHSKSELLTPGARAKDKTTTIHSKIFMLSQYRGIVNSGSIHSLRFSPTAAKANDGRAA